MRYSSHLFLLSHQLHVIGAYFSGSPNSQSSAYKWCPSASCLCLCCTGYCPAPTGKFDCSSTHAGRNLAYRLELEHRSNIHVPMQKEVTTLDCMSKQTRRFEQKHVLEFEPLCVKNCGTIWLTLRSMCAPSKQDLKNTTDHIQMTEKLPHINNTFLT